MSTRTIEEVLAGWLAQADSSLGSLPAGSVPAKWVAERFLEWWEPQVDEVLSDAEAATAAARSELLRLGGWSLPQFGEALHELAHAKDALAELRLLLARRPADPS